jgi:hypothetical protein
MKVRLRAPKINTRIAFELKTFAADSEMQDKYTVEVQNRFQIIEERRILVQDIRDSLRRIRKQHRHVRVWTFARGHMRARHLLAPTFALTTLARKAIIQFFK